LNRRPSLPGAAELFRPTVPVVPPAELDPLPEPADSAISGRRKHESKITVYISEEELYALEHARLVARAKHGLVADRGRIVREAVAVLLADFEERGAESMLVRRLRRESDR
jgi:hypothetical protein